MLFCRRKVVRMQKTEKIAVCHLADRVDCQTNCSGMAVISMIVQASNEVSLN